MVQIDEDKCMGCGACEAICPKGFRIVDGKAKVKDANANCVKEAASVCSQGAIIL